MLPILEIHKADAHWLRGILRAAMEEFESTDSKASRSWAEGTIKMVKICSDAYVNVHKMERQAYEIDNKDKGESSITITRGYV
jgi:hypothetical protein